MVQIMGKNSVDGTSGIVVGVGGIVGADDVVVGANNVKEGKPVARGAYSVIVAGLALSLMLGNAPAWAAQQDSRQQDQSQVQSQDQDQSQSQDQDQSQSQDQDQSQSQDQGQQSQANPSAQDQQSSADQDQPPADQQRPPADQSQAADRAQAPQDAPAPPPKAKSKPKYVQQDANRPPYVNDREQSGNSPYSAPPPSAQDDRAAQDDRDDQGQPDMRQPDDRDDQQPPNQADRQQPPYDRESERDSRDNGQRDNGQQAPDDRQGPPPSLDRDRASRPSQRDYRNAPDRDYNNGQLARPTAPLPAALTIPAGTVLSVRMNDFISSDKNQVGDRITGTLERPIVVNGWVVARRGQTVSGQVTAAVKAGRVKGTSQLGLELTDLTIVDGSSTPILTQMWKGSGGTTHGNDAAAIGGTTALGAVIGSAADWGRGAAIGAGAGAAAGIGAVLLTRGRPTEILPETPLTFRLVDPVTVDTTKSAQAFAPVTQRDYETVAAGTIAEAAVMPATAGIRHRLTTRIRATAIRRMRILIRRSASTTGGDGDVAAGGAESHGSAALSGTAISGCARWRNEATFSQALKPNIRRGDDVGIL